MRIRTKCLLGLAAAALALGVSGPCRAQGSSDPALNASQREYLQAQIETERIRQDVYRSQLRTNEAAINGKPKNVTVMQKFFNDPADSIGQLGAVLGVFVVFFVLIGNRDADRRYRRDARYQEALRRFGEGEIPAARACAAGLLAQWGKTRDRREYPYLDTSVDQLIAGYRLEENDAVRDAIAGALRELILVEPLRTRRKLSDAGIKMLDV